MSPLSLPSQSWDFASRHDSDNSSVYDSGSGSDSGRSSAVSAHRPRPENVGPSTTLCSRSSTETFASTVASSLDDDCNDHTAYARDANPDPNYEIPQLHPYTHDVVDHTVRPSNPADFARLFPSMNRLHICHDDFTDDGNMNLRVTTDATYRNRRISMQLFHLRMYDLARRDFSLRRYCRDSGREVCSIKRHYLKRPTNETKLSVSSVLRKNFSLRRSHQSQAADGHQPAIGQAHVPLCCGTAGSRDSQASNSHQSSSSSSGSSTTSSLSELSSAASSVSARPQRPLATDTVKLEFSNYARVDVTRQSSRSFFHYDFDWWGNHYSWHRVTDEQNMPGVVSFHLYRNADPVPLAHLVPETRSPNQVTADEDANGWVPPCHMWISDKSILNELTDHADVIVATALVSLVDDCIRSKWQQQPAKKPRHRMSMLLLNPSSPLSLAAGKARAQSVTSQPTAAASNLDHWQIASPAAAAARPPRLQPYKKVLSHLHLRAPFRRRSSASKASSPLRFMSHLAPATPY
ncbi:hypothetical protein BROUX41_001209 [Berkeleyomyces rouxiae]|uniref:uncharacterized protein n=1 Tax=Berkeleyomyces rouxiae TaxID=2035830 RepID=UPI003B782310